jgi:sugar phosphate isomerase/epimerase
MRLGLFSWYGYQAPLAQRLQRIKDAGFTSTALWWGDDQLPDPQIDADLMKKASDMGIAIENIHVPFADANRLWAADHDVHKAYLADYLHYLDFSAERGLPMIVMHVSNGNLVQQPNRFGIDTMTRLAKYALEVGVSIAIENTRRGGLIHALLDAIESTNLGLCYDTSHGRLYEDGEFSLLKSFPDRLKCLHISDNDGLEDRHWSIHEGVINGDAFVHALPKGGEYQTLSLEVYPKDENVTEVDFLRDTHARASELRELIESRAPEHGAE